MIFINEKISHVKCEAYRKSDYGTSEFEIRHILFSHEETTGSFRNAL